jgi:hypothetical protein
MTNKPDGKRTSRTRVHALGLLVLLLVVLYMGSYYALERRYCELVGDGSNASPFKIMPHVFYRWDDDYTFILLRWAHTIDMAIRPSRWNQQDETETIMAEERELENGFRPRVHH